MTSGVFKTMFILLLIMVTYLIFHNISLSMKFVYRPNHNGNSYELISGYVALFRFIHISVLG